VGRYELYHETMHFHIVVYVVCFLGLVSLVTCGLAVYHFWVEPIDGWFLLGESLLMAAVTVFVYQFRRLEIIMTYQGITIKFDRIKKFIPWTDIESYRTITANKFLNSGGWKIRLGRSGWYVMYTVIGKPRISLKLNSGKIRELLFSTANPQKVSGIIKEQTGKEETQV
jgi:hypothetical protein